MGILALIQEIIALPGQINLLLARVDALEAAYAEMKKAQLINSIVQTQKDTEAAQSDEDFKKASAANADNLSRL